MPNITLTFAYDINVSVAVGDTAYYTPTTSSGGFDTSSQSSIITIGNITSIDRSTNTMIVNTGLAAPLPANSFIFFSKDKTSNTSSITGYYCSVLMRNNSTIVETFFNSAQNKSSSKTPELFSVGMQTFESSK
jgi:hypothetical protein